MRLTQALLIGVLAVGVTTPVFAEDGYDRSIEFNKKFREDQKRLWGEKTPQTKPNRQRPKKRKTLKAHPRLMDVLFLYFLLPLDLEAGA